MAEAALDLFPEPTGTVDRVINHYQYYRLGPLAGTRAGWIIGGPAWPDEVRKAGERGETPLPQYGTWLPSRRGAVDTRGMPFDPLNEGWRILFQRGGHKEMPVSQVVAYGWHINPPYKGVDFPQLEGLEIESYECPECRLRPTSDPLALADHMRLMHDYTRQDMRAYGEEVGIDFVRGRRRDRTPARALDEVPQQAPVMEMQEVSYDMEYACTRMLRDGTPCDWAPSMSNKNKPLALAAHQRGKMHQELGVNAPALEGGDSNGTPVSPQEVPV